MFPIFTLIGKYTQVLQSNKSEDEKNIAKKHLHQILLVLKVVITRAIECGPRDRVYEIEDKKSAPQQSWLISQTKDIVTAVLQVFPHFANLSEEIKLDALECLQLVLVQDGAIKMVHENALAFLVSTVLDLAVQERNKDLKIGGLELVLKICEAGGIRIAVCFFPGIMISLTKMMNADFKLGSKVLITVLNVLTTVVTLVLNDEQHKDLIAAKISSEKDPLASLRVWKSDGTKQEQLSANKPTKKKKIPKKDESPFERELDEEWLQETTTKYISFEREFFFFIFGADRLKTVLEVVIPAGIRHSHQLDWKFRLVFVKSITSIILKCHKTLESSLPMMIDCIVLHFHDEYNEISSVSQATLKTLAQHLSSALVSLLKQNLFSIFSSLPRQIRTTNDEQTLDSLQRVIGYLSLLGSGAKMASLINSSLPHIAETFFQILELNVYDVRKSDSKSVHLKFLESTPSQTRKFSCFFLILPTPLFKNRYFSN